MQTDTPSTTPLSPGQAGASSTAAAPLARTVLVAGATGLVGREALRQCLQDPTVSQVRALVRKPMSPEALLGTPAVPHVDKLRVCVVDFDNLARHTEVFKVDVVFCALGTTIRKAGSQAAFRQVDFDYPLQIARLARAQGARQFLLVSALGASATSKVFYNRIKGELEEAVRQIDFDHCCVAQPSLLVGQREEFRPGERIGLWLARLLGAMLPPRYRPVQARKVAAGLLAAARTPRAGWHVLGNARLRRMR